MTHYTQHSHDVLSSHIHKPARRSPRVYDHAITLTRCALAVIAYGTILAMLARFFLPY